MTIIDGLAEKLHSLGWSYGWQFRYEGGQKVWQVYAHKGEKEVIIEEATLEDALAETVEKVKVNQDN